MAECDDCGEIMCLCCFAGEGCDCQDIEEWLITLGNDSSDAYSWREPQPTVDTKPGMDSTYERQ